MSNSKASVARKNVVYLLARLDHNLPKLNELSDRYGKEKARNHFVNSLLEKETFKPMRLSHGTLVRHDKKSFRQFISYFVRRYHQKKKMRVSPLDDFYSQGSDFLQKTYLKLVGYDRESALEQLRLELRQRSGKIDDESRLTHPPGNPQAADLKRAREEAEEFPASVRSKEIAEVTREAREDASMHDHEQIDAVAPAHPHREETGDTIINKPRNHDLGVDHQVNLTKVNESVKDPRSLQRRHDSTTDYSSIGENNAGHHAQAAEDREAYNDGESDAGRPATIDLTHGTNAASAFLTASNVAANDLHCSETDFPAGGRPFFQPQSASGTARNPPAIRYTERPLHTSTAQEIDAPNEDQKALSSLPAIIDRDDREVISPVGLHGQVKALEDAVSRAVDTLMRTVEGVLHGEFGEGALLIHPPPRLADLYSKAMGMNWSQKRARLLDEQGFTSPALLSSLVSAYLLSQVFDRPVPWETLLDRLRKENDDSRALYRIWEEELGFDFERNLQRFAMHQVGHPDFYRSTIRPIAEEHARELYATLHPHLNLMCKDLHGEELQVARGGFRDSLVPICTKAMILHGQISASDHIYTWIWRKSGSQTDLHETVDSLDKTLYRVESDTAVVLTTFPGIRYRGNVASGDTAHEVISEALVTFTT